MSFVFLSIERFCEYCFTYMNLSVSLSMTSSFMLTIFIPMMDVAITIIIAKSADINVLCDIVLFVLLQRY